VRISNKAACRSRRPHAEIYSYHRYGYRPSSWNQRLPAVPPSIDPHTSPDFTRPAVLMRVKIAAMSETYNVPLARMASATPLGTLRITQSAP